MPLRRSAAALLGALLATACLPEPPRPPAEFGVHVSAAGNDSARAKFTVVVKGTLELGIRSTIVAMEPDSSLLLATPADLVVNKGMGSAVIVAADSGVELAIRPLDPADSARATARGHAIRLARVDSTRHVTAAPVAALPPKSESHR
jgi:hypothetical protein